MRSRASPGTRPAIPPRRETGKHRPDGAPLGRPALPTRDGEPFAYTRPDLLWADPELGPCRLFGKVQRNDKSQRVLFLYVQNDKGHRAVRNQAQSSMFDCAEQVARQELERDPKLAFAEVLIKMGQQIPGRGHRVGRPA